MVDSGLLFEKDITIYAEAEQFIFQKGTNIGTSTLTSFHSTTTAPLFYSFNKTTNNVRKLPEYQPKLGTGIQVYSILGIIQGKLYSYLMGVTRASFIGTLLTSRIFKIEEVVFISSISNDNNNIIADEDKSYIKMINDFLKRNPLFFSDSLDLTNNMQTAFSKTHNSPSSFIFPTAIQHFCWNFNICRNLDVEGFQNFVYPVINGYASVRTVSDYLEEYTYIVIARKDDRRSGMRFFV